MPYRFSHIPDGARQFFDQFVVYFMRVRLGESFLWKLITFHQIHL